MIPVQQFMPGVLADILRKAPLTPEKVAFAWRSAVGPAVDKATTIDLRQDVLYVIARDASWQREVERSAGLIRSRLTSVLGNVVRSIEVRQESLPRR
ncbi:MAG TPA: DciA family protein [Vicinamibacterales bacterium]|nr:DciA family protein [Vicinamibacterales bacterium]